jgi:hypothetical protein
LLRAEAREERLAAEHEVELGVAKRRDHLEEDLGGRALGRD